MIIKKRNYMDRIQNRFDSQIEEEDLNLFILKLYIGLGKDESAIFDYINNYLRNSESDRDTKSLKEIIKKLTNIIKKFPINSKEIYKVSKSREDNDHIFKAMILNKKRKDQGFSSYSKNPRYKKRAIKTNRIQLDHNSSHKYVLYITNKDILRKSYDISELSIPYRKNCKRTEEEVIFLPGFERAIKEYHTERNITYITL